MTTRSSKTIQFLRRGEVVSLPNVPPARTLLEVLREDLACTGTKEGCGEGDCGACTVVVGEADGDHLRYRAINSCIRLAHSIDGMALWTVEDIAPTLVASRTALPPEGALRLRPGEAGSAAPAGGEGVPTLVASRTTLPPEGALRLRPGEAGSAAPAGGDGAPTLVAGHGEAVKPTLHPAQQAMVDCHASQCGFCTPGFVMSLFGMYQNYIAPTLPTACGSLPPGGAAAPADWQSQIRGPGLKGTGALAPRANPITRELAQRELSGNLCRCTGYRPILDAAQQMAQYPAVQLDEAAVLQKLKLLAPAGQALVADSAYMLPQNLAALLAARAMHPKAQLVAGCTDVGLWVTKLHQQFEQVLDLTQVRELQRIEPYPQHIAIGAAVTLSDAFAALAGERPQLQTFADRFAGLPVRNAGTLGGNVANGSPIGDTMPLLIALGASVVLMSQRGHREMPLETLYSGYRKTLLAPDEVLAWVKVPRPGWGHPVLQTAARSEPGLLHAVQMRAGASGAAAFSPRPLPKGEGVNSPTRAQIYADGLAPSPLRGEGGGEGSPELLRVYKISKRYDDDISAVCLALNLRIDDGVVSSASIGAGGVAATPVRAVQTEAALTGQPWTLQTVQRAMATLRAEFSPISDMRASSAYRSQVLGNLLQRFWLESQGAQQINLESFVLEEAA